ncbi:MAG TPA: hydroxymethylbilane synthase [Acidimicrobiia bacterium]|nr:hydroxymethylbilane synthase [Acidimicrobiia bacterium]
MNQVRIATRRSALALAQARRVADLLVARDASLSVRYVEISTVGDRDQVSPVAELTEIGAFVRSVQQAVLDETADLAVHSLKDLPVAGPLGLDLAAVPERASAFDVLVGSTLAGLPPGSSVGTGSPRRAEQLLDLRPDLRTIELRGNVDTRLDKVASGEVDGAVLAEAGLDRLGRTGVIAERLDPAQMVPAPGQGALAVEARTGSRFAALAALIDDLEVRVLVTTERMLLAETGAGCRSALGAHATRDGDQIRLDAFVADGDGRRRSVNVGATPESVVAAARRDLGI